MKIKLLAIIALFISVVTQAQTTQPSSKVASAFTQEELNGKSEIDIRYMNFVAEKGFVMHQAGKEGVSYPNISSVLKAQFSNTPVNTLSAATFNPFMVNASRDIHQFFKIDGTDMVVQIYSDSYATTIFSDFLINERNKARK
jgi:hypothetical protein